MRGLATFQSARYVRDMTRRKPQFRTSVSAFIAALPRAAEAVSADRAERADLIQVVEGFTSPHDSEAARREIEWMREHYRRLGRPAQL